MYIISSACRISRIVRGLASRLLLRFFNESFWKSFLNDLTRMIAECCIDGVIAVGSEVKKGFCEAKNCIGFKVLKHSSGQLAIPLN